MTIKFPYLPIFLIMLCVFCCIATGCGDRRRPAPRVEVSTPPDARSGNVVISYVLYDSESLPADIAVQYSIDGGISYFNATEGSGGDGTTSLATNERGIAHSFIWDSVADAGYVNEDNARILIAAITRKTSVPSTTSNFLLENYADGSWEPNIRIDDDAGIASATSPAIAAEGDNIYAAWTDYRNGHADIYFTSSANAGTTWEAAFIINDDATSTDQVTPSIACDGSGNIYIVWTDARDGGTSIYLSSGYDPGTGIAFTANSKVSSASALSAIEPAIAVESANIYVAWTDSRSGNRDVFFRRSTDSGSSWDDEILVNDDAGSTDQYEPAIAADGSGNIYLAWTDYRNADADIFSASGADSGGVIVFASNVRVDDAPSFSPSVQPSIGVYGSNIYVAYADYRNVNWDIYFATSLDSGVSFPTNLKASDGPNSLVQDQPSIAINGSTGEIYVVFRDERSDGPSVYFSSSTTPTTGFTANLRIDDCASPALQDSPAVAYGSRVFVVFRDQRDSDDNIYFTRRPKN